MKKIVILMSFIIYTATSCVNPDINLDIKRASDVPAATLFTNAQKELVDALADPNVNTGVFRLLAQQWAQTTYADESNYNLITRNIPQNFWNRMYRDVLRNFSEAEKLLKASNATNDPEFNLKNNKVAINQILMIYAYSILVDTYGDIPYSQALDINNSVPKYDDAATIYNELFVKLDVAMANLEINKGSFSPETDIIYGGDVKKWLKFANSLKLRMGMTLADVNPTKSKSVVEAAFASGVFTSNGDNATFKYLSIPPNTNPIWVELVQSGRFDFVASNTIIDIMNDLDDPRRQSYFTKNAGGIVYTGGIFGSLNTYGNFSQVNPATTITTFPHSLLEYPEIAFYLAEAAERGYSVGNTASFYYDSGIEASILSWGGTSADVATYLALPNVAYVTATGTYKQKIGVQKWIALYNRGFEAWTEYRRLDAPKFNVPPDVTGPFPNRFSYPIQEQNLNVVNYNAAAAIIGGDTPDKKVFWDKF